MAEPAKTYVHLSGQRGIFCEVYFPRRVTAQGTIFTALEEGYNEGYVKKYLTRHVKKIFQEMEDYRHIVFTVDDTGWTAKQMRDLWDRWSSEIVRHCPTTHTPYFLLRL